MNRKESRHFQLHTIWLFYFFFRALYNISFSPLYILDTYSGVSNSANANHTRMIRLFASFTQTCGPESL